jgi:predicted phosphodiesterase
MVREMRDDGIKVARSSMQAAFEREFGICSYDELCEFDIDDGEVEQEKRITKCSLEDLRMAVICDMHYEYHDESAIHMAAKTIQSFNPDEVVMAGDIQDMYAVSSFSRDPNRITQLQGELNVGYKMNRLLVSSAPEANWYFVPGNHEARWDRFLNKSPEIANLDAMRIESLMRMDDLGIKYGGVERWYCNDRLAVIHGRRYSKHGGYAAKNEADDRLYQQDVIQGHNHKSGNWSAGGPLRVCEAYEVACLCDLNPHYKPTTRWNHGMMLVEIISSTPYYNNLKFHTNSPVQFATVYVSARGEA